MDCKIEMLCFCFCGDCDVIAVHYSFLSTYGFNCYCSKLKFNVTIVIVIYDPFPNKYSLATGPTSSFMAVLTCAD